MAKRYLFFISIAVLTTLLLAGCAGSTEPENLPTPIEKDLPDLVVIDTWRAGDDQTGPPATGSDDSTWFTFHQGDTWRYIVKNQGEAFASGSMSKLVIDGENRTYATIAPLEAGESREHFFTHSYECESGASHTWSVFVEARKQQDESNEDNNESEKKEFVCP